MIDDRSEPTSKESTDAGALANRRRLLELQLVKIRNEATAARLDARAAEIELMIRQLGAAGEFGSYLPTDSTGPTSSGPTSSGPAIDPGHLLPGAAASGDSRFGSWDEVRSARVATAAVESVSADAAGFTRIDGAQNGVQRPQFLDAGDHGCDPASDRNAGDATCVASGVISIPDESKEMSLPLPRVVSDESRSPAEVVSDQISIERNQVEDEESENRDRKPAAWMISTIAHVAVLIVLAAVTLRSHRPKDQVSLSASTAEANEVSMETFTIESSQPESEATEPTPTETEYDLSPVGDISATEFAVIAPFAPPSPAAAAMTNSAVSSASAMSLDSDSDAKIQFCGVEGGGNHFVYLVDSSGSMGEGFESARAELLASIAVLKPDQRFYVVFFDAKSDFMRLGSAKQDEPQSVSATPENKAALKRWAMRIAMDRGRAPYDPLRFALKLKPDVIFLLSDGEFPQGIEDLLREENRVENLFGDSHPISIVHTIGYHSKEGESRMRRIAEQNKGQYRYIPKP